MMCRGKVQKVDGVIHVIAERVTSLNGWLEGMGWGARVRRWMVRSRTRRKGSCLPGNPTMEQGGNHPPPLVY